MRLIGGSILLLRLIGLNSEYSAICSYSIAPMLPKYLQGSVAL